VLSLVYGEWMVTIAKSVVVDMKADTGSVVDSRNHVVGRKLLS